jgi:hypothetical protein
VANATSSSNSIGLRRTIVPATSTVHAGDEQVAAGDALDRAPQDRCEHGPQQQIARVVGQVVVATALVGAQDAQLVAGAERDHRLARVDARVLACADRS